MISPELYQKLVNFGTSIFSISHVQSFYNFLLKMGGFRYLIYFVLFCLFFSLLFNILMFLIFIFENAFRISRFIFKNLIFKSIRFTFQKFFNFFKFLYKSFTQQPSSNNYVNSQKTNSLYQENQLLKEQLLKIQKQLSQQGKKI